MALDRQIHLYSVDTSFFYSSREAYLHRMNQRYRQEHRYLRERALEYETLLTEYGYSLKDLTALTNGRIEKMSRLIPGTNDLLYEYLYIRKLMKYKKERIKKSKERLTALLSRKAEQNIHTNGRDHVRRLNLSGSNDTDIISVFDSALTRTIGIEPDSLTEALLIVQIYYLDVFKDISFFGFWFHGEKYRYYTSSAGQIRQKKAVFIKESVWHQYEKTIMCGLTIDKINEKGGNNVNKHLAYMALTNSATDLWKDFDIDKTIVVDDFETDVFGIYDFIDDTDYSITRKTGCVPITHTDGAGMVLPSVLQRNAMFRAPWIKGLLGVFDFRAFIKEHGCSSVIMDIYGKEHDVIAEDIRIIFTKSQFKMHKYYRSWDEYKSFFREYQCTAGLCHMEEERIRNARTNYQMLQTLTDITEKEIRMLSKKSADRIENLCVSIENILEALGITPYNHHMTPFQEALKLYPALLSDTYTKDILKNIKDSLLRKYRSGKLEINGKYTFLLPDYYAACEYWFCHVRRPEGLLKDGEVFCHLLKHHDKLDCLRSPHLYKEHAVRLNTAARTYGDRADRIRRWFPTNALYTSSHDLISKILQFDVDGDKSLVVADPDFVRIAERNMKGIVPLYYNMRKADPEELNSPNIYRGLTAAFSGGNIGIYSNSIAKIWNSEVFLSGTEREKQDAVSLIKLLCMENNFVIDYAKTLYRPGRPDWLNQRISVFAKRKLPAFFEFAKAKEPQQLEERNSAFVNRLYDLIPDKPISTRGLELEAVDPQKLMTDPDIQCPKDVSDLYTELNRTYRYKFCLKDDADNAAYVARELRQQFTSLGYDEQTIADMLVRYCYENRVRFKELLWFSFGTYILNSLRKNIPAPNTRYIQCADCGEWFEAAPSSRGKRCRLCRENARKQKYARYNAKRK